jgi:hypothetical protein
MRLRWNVWALAATLCVPAASRAATCTAQAELTPQDRAALADTGGRLAQAVVQQDTTMLQSALLPAEAQDWNNIQGAIQQAGPAVKGGQIQLRSIYLLDATGGTAPAEAQFFCSNGSGTLTVTITMHALPPGRYAVVLADAVGAPLAGQLGLILAWDGSAWRLAGFSAHQGMFDGHDGIWYWSRARGFAGVDPWSAWYSYEAARYLLIPVDFLLSPNLEKLQQEQTQIQGAPTAAFPYSLTVGDRTWKIDAVHLEPTLNQSDLAVVYESAGVTDPAAQRTEAIAVLSALLKAQRGLRANFHGLWAIASKDNKQTPVIEMPMTQIP